MSSGAEKMCGGFLSLSFLHSSFSLHPFLLSWWGGAGRLPRGSPHFAASEPAEIYRDDKMRLEATGSEALGEGGGAVWPRSPLR